MKTNRTNLMDVQLLGVAHGLWSNKTKASQKKITNKLLLFPFQSPSKPFKQLSELGRPFTGGSWCGKASGHQLYFSETSTVTASVKVITCI